MVSAFSVKRLAKNQSENISNKQSATVLRIALIKIIEIKKVIRNNENIHSRRSST